jgi:hypothetical protein
MNFTKADQAQSGSDLWHGSPRSGGAGRLSYHFLTAVDVEGFSRLSAQEQVGVQADLALVLDTAAARAGLDRGSWYRQPSGDGELAVLPQDADTVRVVGDYPRELHRALAESNARPEAVARLRIRMTLHHGTLVPGTFGPAGQAPILVTRLLNCDELRRELSRTAGLDLVYAVSASLYADVVRTRLAGVDPAEFRPMEFVAKGVPFTGYVHRGRTGSPPPRMLVEPKAPVSGAG